jgi:hypothetical protein
MKSENKTVTTKKGDAELSTSKKLDQIRTGEKIKRSKGATESKNVISAGAGGAKYFTKETEEKYEETAVLRKKRNYVMYESKLGTEKNTEIVGQIAPLKPKAPPKPVRQPEPRNEEKIIQTKKKKEYLDNYQYHETKELRRNNPRYQVIVEHKRLGDVIGGTFEETSYQRQVFAQGSNRPQLTETKTTTTKTGTAIEPKLRGNKSQITNVKKTITGNVPQTPAGTSVTKRTTRTTTSNTNTNSNPKNKNPVSTTATKEKIQETTMKRRNEGTVQKTESRTETKTTTTGTRGQGTSSSTTTKTTTKTTTEKPAGGETTTKTTTTKTETKTESKETKGDEAGGSSIRKKYAKKKF